LRDPDIDGKIKSILGKVGFAWFRKVKKRATFMHGNEYLDYV
jgi:hypothetical protein